MTERCKNRVRAPGSHFGQYHQCSRAAKQDGYCAQHHPNAKAARRIAGEQRWQARVAAANAPQRRAEAIREAAQGVLDAWFRSGIRTEDPQAEEALIALSTAMAPQ